MICKGVMMFVSKLHARFWQLGELIPETKRPADCGDCYLFILCATHLSSASPLKSPG